MRIALYPFHHESNKYIDLIKKAYANINIEVAPFENFYYREIKDVTYVMFNWYENIHAESTFHNIKLCALRSLNLFLLFLLGKKIVWTLHNKKPHNKKGVFFSKIVMFLLVKLSTKIIIHSKASVMVLKGIYNNRNIAKKIVHVPHPNYTLVYGESPPQLPHNNGLQLFFLGAIKPYKNLDILIDIFTELNLPDTFLSLYGEVSDKKYESYLLEKIGASQTIRRQFSFVNDNDIPSIFLTHHIMVIPYDVSSVLNSGSVILAFSYSRTTLSPINGTLLDIDDKKLFFSYDYKNENEHREKLRAALTNLYDSYHNHVDKLLRLGEKCRRYVEKNNSLEEVSKNLLKIFE